MRHAALALAAAATVLTGQQVFEHGAPGGVIPCAACHGLDGHGRPGTGAPRLAGLTAKGVLANLGVLASGGSSDVVMQHVAASLTPTERDAVAAYVATLH